MHSDFQEHLEYSEQKACSELQELLPHHLHLQEDRAELRNLDN